MARIIGMVALLLGTLALVGCGMGPYGYGDYGYGGDPGYGSYGASCPQSYGSPQSCGAMPFPMPMQTDPGYAGGYAAPYYQPQPYPYPQPYYGNGAPLYPPQYQSDPYASPYDQRQAYWNNPEAEGRMRYRMDRIQQRLDSGQLSPQEYQRLEAEQNHLQAAMGRMRADGRFGPQESVNQMPNGSNQDFSSFNHHGATGSANSGPTSSTGTTLSNNGFPTGSGFQPGQGNGVQPGNHPAGQAGYGPMAWGGRGAGFQPGNGPMAQRGPVNGPGFQPNNRMMMGRPPMFNGARFQPRPMQPRPQMTRPGPGPRMQPNGGGGFRRISYPHGG